MLYSAIVCSLPFLLPGQDLTRELRKQYYDAARRVQLFYSNGQFTMEIMRPGRFEREVIKVYGRNPLLRIDRINSPYGGPFLATVLHPTHWFEVEAPTENGPYTLKRWQQEPWNNFRAFATTQEEGILPFQTFTWAGQPIASLLFEFGRSEIKAVRPGRTLTDRLVEVVAEVKGWGQVTFSFLPERGWVLKKARDRYHECELEYLGVQDGIGVVSSGVLKRIPYGKNEKPIVVWRAKVVQADFNPAPAELFEPETFRVSPPGGSDYLGPFWLGLLAGAVIFAIVVFFLTGTRRPASTGTS